MKRDMEVLRRLLVEIESWPNQFISALRLPQLEGVEESVVAEHVHQLYEAGYIDAIDFTSHGSAYKKYAPSRLTAQGQEFLAAIRSQSIWAKLKAKAEEEGGSLPLSIVKQLGEAFLKKKLDL